MFRTLEFVSARDDASDILEAANKLKAVGFFGISPPQCRQHSNNNYQSNIKIFSDYINGNDENTK